MLAAPFKDKFVAFIDIMGFKSMIAAAERGEGRSLDEIETILTELARRRSKEFYAGYGPEICPDAPRLANDLDFEISQVSDCTIVSCEVSPAGIVNLVQHCWGMALKLMGQGVLVRGYITRGPIAHSGERFFGTGYHKALAGESAVTAFGKPDEKGTPFIEVDPEVLCYVAEQGDRCVREMVEEVLAGDETVKAIFPFKRLAHSFAIGGFGGIDRTPFDPHGEKAANARLRDSLDRYKAGLMQYIDPTDARAMGKIRHYLAALDVQIAGSHELDGMIDALSQPFPNRRL